MKKVAGFPEAGPSRIRPFGPKHRDPGIGRKATLEEQVDADLDRFIKKIDRRAKKIRKTVKRG